MPLSLNKLICIYVPKEICEYGNYLITLHSVFRSNVILLNVKLNDEEHKKIVINGVCDGCHCYGRLLAKQAG